MGLIDELQREIDRVGAELRTAFAPRRPTLGIAAPGGLPSVRATSGGVPPFQAVQVARKIALVPTLGLTGVFIENIVWTMALIDQGNPSLWTNTVALRQSIIIPNGWEGGGLYLSATLNCSAITTAMLLQIVKNGQFLTGSASPALGGGGDAVCNCSTIDEAPQIGDVYQVAFESLTNTDNVKLEAGTSVHARQIFPL